MSEIALFHSVLGVRPGIIDAAERLTRVGHDVTVVDQYDGQVFDDYDEASTFVQSIGYPTLMEAADRAVSALADGFIALGFSNGGGMAEYVATKRKVGGVVMLSGTLGLDQLGVERWPHGVPAQIHYSIDDPFRNQEWIGSVVQAVRDSESPVEMFDYPGSGHLFTDPSLTDEYDSDNAQLLWERVIDFCSQK
jgi:dienelactone hydrolase